MRVDDSPVAGLLAQVAWVDLVDCDEATAKARLLAAATNSRAKPAETPAFPGGASGASAKPTFPSDVSAIWNVPARNRNFTGRTEWLTQLARAVGSEPTVVTQAIRGLGGIGKTQLAVEFAHRHAANYRLVSWVRAESAESRRADLAALGKRLELPRVDGVPTDAHVAIVRGWLERNGGWLLIFDNVESPDDVRDLLPQAGSGHVVLTSRNQSWGQTANPLALELWSRNEAVSYLLKRTKLVDDQAATTLATRSATFRLRSNRQPRTSSSHRLRSASTWICSASRAAISSKPRARR